MPLCQFNAVKRYIPVAKEIHQTALCNVEYGCTIDTRLVLRYQPADPDSDHDSQRQTDSVDRWLIYTPRSIE